MILTIYGRIIVNILDHDSLYKASVKYREVCESLVTIDVRVRYI